MCSIQTLCVNVYILGHWEATKCCERQLRTKITDCNLSWFHSCFTLINCFLCLGLYIFLKKKCADIVWITNTSIKSLLFKLLNGAMFGLTTWQSTSAQASIFTFSWSSPLVPSTVSPLLLSSCRDTQRENRKCLMSRSETQSLKKKHL